jgi:5'-phosphate synthase pdxT subunit
MRIGVLALQGDFAEHITMLRRLGVEAVEVRLPDQLEGLDGLIIPGGESTTIGKLAGDYRLIEPLPVGMDKPSGAPVPGDLLSRMPAGATLAELMDIQVERNAFGRQVASFEIDLDVPRSRPSL